MGKSDMDLVLCSELLINGHRIIGESCFKLRVLPEILVWFHMYALPGLLYASALLVKPKHLLIEIVEVVSKAPKLACLRQFKMTWNHCVERQVEHPIKGVNPVFGAAVVHCGRRAVEK